MTVFINRLLETY